MVGGGTRRGNPRDSETLLRTISWWGSHFFALRPKRSILSDTNKELINCYRQVRDDPQSVLYALRKLRNTETNYYAVRRCHPTDRVERAARLLFLTTLSFNGIFRQNLNGIFNVPYGKKTHIKPADSTKIIAASKALQGSKLVCGDFEKVTGTAVAGDRFYQEKQTGPRTAVS